MQKLAITFITTLTLALTLQAQDAKQPCAAPEYRQFDFWIGDWEVWAGDKLVGTNDVQQILGTCVIMENWIGAGQSRGKSFNTYNQLTGKWEQTWVDNGGNTIHFYGGMQDGKMRMEGESTARDGKPVKYILEFTPNKDGSVRQFWQGSKDGGEWNTLFDAVYKKKGGN